MLALATRPMAAQHKSVFPPGVKPVGPYSPGVVTTDFVYVSGQGARDLANKLPTTLDGQVRQCLDNVKMIVETSGLTMQHVVTTQVYLADIAGLDTLNKVWKEYFPKGEPARTVIGVARMPTETPVEIAATAVRDLSRKKPIGGTVGTGDRVFLSGSTGDGVKEALAGVRKALQAAGMDLRHLAYLNVYLDSSVNHSQLASALTAAVPKGMAWTLVPSASLPAGAHVQISGVASRSVKRSRACGEVGDTLYCSGRSGTAKQALEGLGNDLKSAGASLGLAVASNVYIEDLDQFAAMNKLYATYFGVVAPTRTTVQPVKAGPASSVAGGDGSPRVQVAVVVVR